MLSEPILEYIVEEIKERYKLIDMKMIEKSINDKRIRLKFSRSGLRMLIEINNSEMIESIYHIMLTPTERKDVYLDEFKEDMKVILKEENLIESSENLRNKIEAALERRKKSKIF